VLNVSLDTLGLNEITREAIRRVRLSGGAMAEVQYAVIYATITRLAPTSTLVWSLGRDSPLWRQAAGASGRVAFFEDSADWIRRLGPLIREQALDVHRVRYLRSARRAAALVPAAKQLAWRQACCAGPSPHALCARRGEVRANESLVVPLPPSLSDGTCWRVLLVDGPLGMGPGRMESLASAASALHSPSCAAASGSAHVFVHDAERWAEDTFSRLLFGMHDVGSVQCHTVLWPATDTPLPKAGQGMLRHLVYRYPSASDAANLTARGCG